MEKFDVVKRDIVPSFDLEEFMIMSQESRLGGATLERLAKLWQDWSQLLDVREIKFDKASYLAIWLPESVEDEVDKTWSQSPSDGYLLSNLAQFMCMSVAQEMLPQVESVGCAPAPKPFGALRECISQFGLNYKKEDVILDRRYAMVTYSPFRGGCEICCLQSKCPKGLGQSESMSIVLPGYEHKEND